jgi:general secretion pathway protein B
MSFILDALKKSEIERQRQSTPGLMDTPAALRRGRLPLWAILLGALLAINIAVLGVVLMRNGAPAAAAPAAAANRDTVPAAEKKAAADEHFSPLSQEPVYAPEIPLPPADEALPSKSSAALLAASHAPAQRAAPHAVHHPDPVLVEEDAKENDELLPSINQLNLTGAQALPELHLDVHVYATKPADRFVYINMRKYHEGNTLQEGPVLERIRRDGVVLSYQGLRFLLPRQS